LTDKTVKAGEDNTNNVSSVSNVGGTGKVFGYEDVLGDLAKMNKDFMDSIESKVTTKLEEVSKKLEEVSEELRSHKEEEARARKHEETDVQKGTTGVPFKRKPAGTKLEDDDEARRREEEESKREEEVKTEAKIVYRPIFVSNNTKKASVSMSEEEISKRREERAKKLEEIKRKMEERRQKLAYEASTKPVAQGKAQTASVEDKPASTDSNTLVSMPGAPDVKIPAWMADVLKNFKTKDAQTVSG